MINSPVQLHLSYTNRRPESSTFLTLLNTITTVVAETPGEQLQRLLIAPLLETAELEDDNHVISVDLRHFRISLMGELDGDLSSCGSTQQNRTDIGSESVQSGCLENDSNIPSQSFHISKSGLVDVVISSWLIYWSQSSHKLSWEGYGCSFWLDAPRECWVIYLGSSLVSTVAFGGVGGFGGVTWNDWKEQRDGKNRRVEEERMKLGCSL